MEVMEANYEFLSNRFINQLSPQEKATFVDALHLCPTNALVNEINESKMSATGNPVLTLPAWNKGPGAQKAMEDEVEGLQPKLVLMKGAKVMLTRNLGTLKALTNGSMGIIDIFPLKVSSNTY